MYIEGVKDGREFLSVLKDVAAKKPVIINKAASPRRAAERSEPHRLHGGTRNIWESVIRRPAPCRWEACGSWLRPACILSIARRVYENNHRCGRRRRAWSGSVRCGERYAWASLCSIRK
jgi:acyl-CoA synthetase (NDP forming)